MGFPPLQSGLQKFFPSVPSLGNVEQSLDVSSSGRNYISLEIIVRLSAVILELFFVYVARRFLEIVPFLFFVISSFSCLSTLVSAATLFKGQRHSYSGMAYSYPPILLERLLDYNSFGRFLAEDFVIGLGLGLNENAIKISGGQMENESSVDLFYSRLRAFQGIDENEYVVYGNEKSIIMISDSESEEAIKLTNIIHQHTKESVLPKTTV